MLGVTYSGWVEEDGKVGRIFDSNAEKGVVFKMTVGAGKVIKVRSEGFITRAYAYTHLQQYTLPFTHPLTHIYPHTPTLTHTYQRTHTHT